MSEANKPKPVSAQQPKIDPDQELPTSETPLTAVDVKTPSDAINGQQLGGDSPREESGNSDSSVKQELSNLESLKLDT